MIHGLALLALAWSTDNGQRTPREQMVDRALVYLRKTQQQDGSWASNGKKPGVTSLVLLAFLSTGSGPSKGPDSAAVAKGLRWVLDQQADSGLIASEGGDEMYHHGIATLMLAEALRGADGDLAKELEKKLDNAVAVILKAQRTEGAHEGAWRYRIKGVDGDLSVSGWQIQALRAAKKAGREVTAKSLDAAVQYVLKAQDPLTGGFRYFPSSRLTIPCSAVGLLVLEGATDEKQKEAAARAEVYLSSDRSLPRWGSPHFFYGLYYGAKAMHGRGGKAWKTYQAALDKVLGDNQGLDGSWKTADGSQIFGINYSTAMAVLCLTVDGYTPPEKPKD
jgi:hypothetical protein